MRIVFSTSFDEGTRSIARAAEALAEAQRQLSSGRRIGHLSDDPLGSAAAVTEHAALGRLDSYTSASDAAEYRLSVADSVMSDIVNQLTAAQTTALAARGSTQTQGQRDAAASELLAIRDALLGDVSTKVQGAYLFSGSNVTVAPYVKSGGTISSYQGNAAPSVIDIGSGRAVASTFDADQIFKGSDAQDVLQTLTDLAAAVSAGDQTGVTAGVDALTRAFDRATAAQARVGNDLKTVDDTKALMAAARTTSTERISTIEDADLAEASVHLAEAETAYRAALGAVSTLGQLSLMDYLR